MTDDQFKKMFKDIIILVDTREQKNKEILDYFDKTNIRYESQCLKFADYSFKIALDELNYTSFENYITIEKKANLDELSNNLTKGRERFIREIEKSQKVNAKFILLVEKASWNKIRDHKYRSNLNPKGYIGTLKSFRNRYNIQIDFIEREEAGAFILEEFYYYLRNYLKSEEVEKNE